MAGGFIAYRCSNYENTAEREQFRTLCKQLKRKYYKSEKLCFLIANYNIFDSEFDAILVKNDAIIAIEFKNYGGNIKAVENGDWTSNGVPISGGSRKTVYQQARVNHASLRNGLNELGINGEWIKDLPSIIVFNKLITLDNRLSNKVQSWLHITDNAHFIEKIDDITCRFTNMSNSEMVDLAIKLNLNSFIDKDLSSLFTDDNKNIEEPEDVLQNAPEVIEEDVEVQSINSESKAVKENVTKTDRLTNYERFTPNHIFSLRPNQIFVFGTDRKGSQKYGAAGLAANKFGAQVGITEGPTGLCYALPTKGFELSNLAEAVEKLINYIKKDTQHTYLITPVGCGHAGFNPAEVASLFKDLVSQDNVMLPKLFIDELILLEENSNVPDTEPSVKEVMVKNILDNLKSELRKCNKSYNEEGSFTLRDENGEVIAEAELGIYDEKIVFSPFNIQSLTVFKNYGYNIMSPEEYLSQNR